MFVSGGVIGGTASGLVGGAASGLVEGVVPGDMSGGGETGIAKSAHPGFVAQE
jgi:hypothetical protein